MAFKMNSPAGKAILARARNGDYAHPGEEEAILAAVEGLPRGSIRRLLDVGCGRGGTADWFRRQGWGEVTGIDIDALSIRYASQRYPEVRFQQQDICSLAAGQFNGFDLIYLFTALYAFPDQAEALRRMRNAARSGGFLLLVDYTRPAGSPPPPELGPEIGNPIERETLAGTLSAAGWALQAETDWSRRFVGWYEDLLMRFERERDWIVGTHGPDWYAYVTGWYGALRQALDEGRLGGTVVRAVAEDRIGAA
ncbi:MAG: methyltransferase domain-containing protein [Methylococcus sp.]|nr:methyltransferase domain-containing protein [Methylococcus sp.]